MEKHGVVLEDAEAYGGIIISDIADFKNQYHSYKNIQKPSIKTHIDYEDTVTCFSVSLYED